MGSEARCRRECRSAEGSPHRESSVHVFGVLVLGHAGDIGIQSQVLPPVVKGGEGVVRCSRSIGVERINKCLAFGGVQEITIEDIEAVLHFAVVGHAVGVA